MIISLSAIVLSIKISEANLIKFKEYIKKMLPIQIPSNKEITEGKDTTVISDLVLISPVLFV